MGPNFFAIAEKVTDPFTLSNGSKRWTAREDIYGMIRPESPGFLRVYQSHLRYYLADESRFSDEALAQRDTPLSGVFGVENASKDLGALYIRPWLPKACIVHGPYPIPWWKTQVFSGDCNRSRMGAWMALSSSMKLEAVARGASGGCGADSISSSGISMRTRISWCFRRTGVVSMDTP